MFFSNARNSIFLSRFRFSVHFFITLSQIWLQVSNFQKFCFAEPVFLKSLKGKITNHHVEFFLQMILWLNGKNISENYFPVQWLMLPWSWAKEKLKVFAWFYVIPVLLFGLYILYVTVWYQLLGWLIYENFKLLKYL